MIPTKTTGKFSLAYITMKDDLGTTQRYCIEKSFEVLNCSENIPTGFYGDGNVKLLDTKEEGYSIQELLDAALDYSKQRASALRLDRPPKVVIEPENQPLYQRIPNLETRVNGSIKLIAQDVPRGYNL